MAVVRARANGVREAAAFVPFVPAWVTEVELARPLEEVRAPRRADGEHYARARALVRVHAQPIGFLELALDEGVLPAERLVDGVNQRLGGALQRHLATDGLARTELTPAGVTAPEAPPCGAPGPCTRAAMLVSVVVCSRDRAPSLRRTLRSLLAVDGVDLEIVVVDSAPTTEATRAVVRDLADPRIKYLLEPAPGLSRARNRGVREARGAVLAFTDDDVVVDPGWLRALLRGFSRATHVGCVTGLVPGAELETPAQAFFEAKVSWGSGFERRLYDLGEHRAPERIAGALGTGANFALARAALNRIGDFDEALGAGAPPQGGEDLDYFFRTLAKGYTIAYEPAALVWHVHRRESDGLGRQLYGYGAGLTAFVFKHLAAPSHRREVASRLVAGLPSFALTGQEVRQSTAVPSQAHLMELRGMLAGPLVYARATRRSGATQRASAPR